MTTWRRMSLAAVIGGSIQAAVWAGAAGAAPTFTKPPTAAKAGDRVKIEFAVDGRTDVEVAILDAKGAVVRHLAAGVLGGKKAPPAPLKPGLAQNLKWDGKDDYGVEVSGFTFQAGTDFSSPTPSTLHPQPFSIRVRAGMGVKLDTIVGGDPYAFYSKEMGQGDHAAWRLTGLEAKPDGTVYVLANANNYGPPALRAYAADGEYLRTVYPPPAGKPLEAVKGWGVTTREDGTWTPLYNDLSSPALSKTIISGTRGRIASLVPSPGRDRLLLVAPDFRLMQVNTDGTIPANPMLDGLFVNEPAIVHPERNVWNVPWEVTGQMQACASPDGKSIYLAGLFARTLEKSKVVATEKTTPWRDGQVFRVDAATRQATVFFALPEDAVIADMAAREKSPIADAKYGNYAALHGVAVDREGRVFVCDRQNKRIVALGPDGKIIREIPCEYPDKVAVHPKSKALFVTVRTGHYHGGGDLKLLKFDDWSKDSAPSAAIPLCGVHHYSLPTCLAVAVSSKGVFLWVAYSSLPVRVYREKDAGLELVKDFYEAGPQRALDLQHMVADPRTGTAYLSDGWGNCFRVADWKAPRFERCMQDAKTPLRALSLAIDARNRFIYGHADRSPVARYRLDGEFFTPAPPEGAKENAFTQKISNDWRIGLGLGDRGIAAAPDGSLATLGAHGTTGADYSGPLNFFKADTTGRPWEPLLFTEFGKARSGGIRFDARGNLYVGKADGKASPPPKGFEKSGEFLDSTGRIYKYAPTESPAGGDLFPAEPAAPARVYDVHYGSIGPHFTRTPRFGVDGYGRIYYPTSLLPQVSVIDNEGNPILAFGTYGNRDSLGGLPGDLTPVAGIPMAWPNSVDATDDHILVSDIVNIRLMRLAKTFAVAETVGLK